MSIRVRIIVEDEWDDDEGTLEDAQREASRLAHEIAKEHLVSATIESVVEVKE